ncbi:MAG: prolipoprotein diacylglyceryl transferase family protein [Lysobacter sp.]
MVSLGPIPMPIVLLVAGLLMAGAVGRVVARRQARNASDPPIRVLPLFTDMLLVALLAGRLVFVLQWWELYREDLWSIIRPDDGGYSVWAAITAGLAFGAWRARRHVALRRPFAWGTVAGLATWAFLAGSLTLMQQAGIRLPDTQLERLEGGTVQLSGLAGEPMVVNLWATWCPPCRREMPVLAEGQQSNPDINFVFANQGEGGETIRQYLDDTGLSLQNVVLDPFSSVSQETGARGLPTTLFFNAHGQLVDIHMGELTRAGLAQKLERFAPAVKTDP